MEINLPLGLGVAFLSLLWVFIEIWFTYRNKTLTPQQFFSKYTSVAEGRPFVWHGGLWGDIFLLTPLFAYIVARFSTTWAVNDFLLVFSISILMSGILHWIYSSTPFPDSLAWKTEGLTIAGWFHFVYMTFAFTVLGLFYLFTPEPEFIVSLLVGLLLALHVFIGTHTFIAILNRTIFHFTKFPDRLSNIETWGTLIGAWVTIALLTVIF